MKAPGATRVNRPRRPPQWWLRTLRWMQRDPAASHLLRALERFFSRLGDQFAGSISFLTVLALIPVLTFAFSALGFTLTVIRPDWLIVVRDFIAENLSAGPLQDQIMRAINQYLFNWRNIGLFAFGTAVFIGAGWVGNIKTAIRGIGRPDFDTREQRRPFLLDLLLNFLTLFVLMILLALSFVITVVGSQLAGTLVDHLKVTNGWISEGLVQLASLLLGFVTSTLIFFLIFRFFPSERAPKNAVVRGSIIAGFAFTVLQRLAGWLTGLFMMSRATQFFGPVIVMMLLFNVFAYLLLLVTAWIATWNQPAVARRYNPADEILRNRSTTVTVPDHWYYADRDRERKLAMGGLLAQEAAAALSADEPLAQRDALHDLDD